MHCSMMQPTRQRASLSSTASNGSFFSRTFSKRGTSQIEGSAEYPKGAIGLTTLYDPGKDVVADLIFVHGLNGGSESTWTKDNNPSLFWPSAWLPKDEAFHDVRIHTFGYASGLSRESVLHVPDFACALLAAIHDSPIISSKSRIPMILVGHSMGGLVAKKAFILGHQTKEFETVARNIFAMFFLATPHQGAGIADTLAKILALAPGSRPFVHDLSPESPVLQSINEEFPLHSSSLKLFSFYENRPMKIGISTQLIVEKRCAVMNYPNERRTYLDANHRNVAKFAFQTDPSYIAVRNALATTIATKRTSRELSKQRAGVEQMETLSAFLDITEMPDKELEDQSLRLPETCDWFFEKEGFQEWRDVDSSKTLWVSGRPGAGKSVLSAHIIHCLRKSGSDCCSYFFVRGDETRATINTFLRSIAWQMATQHPQIMSIILEMASSSYANTVNKADHVALWRRLFLGGILKCRLNTPQYWVIDAIDECKGSQELASILSKIQDVWPIRILVSSREPLDKHTNGVVQKTEVISEAIEPEDTNRDIAHYLQTYQDHLPVTSFAEREAITKEILKNSNGCFLWATLVLKELRQAYTFNEIRVVLSGNTANMDELYRRILSDMASAKFGKDLAKAILTWTTFSFRVLSTDELHCAIELDIEDKVDNIERSISACCGQLVYVDRAKKVQLLHLTVRDFLTRQGMDSEFKIDQATAHKRLALVCLRYLTRNQKRSNQIRKLNANLFQEERLLMDYACGYLFQHLVHVNCDDVEVLAALSRFMASDCVLNWMQQLAMRDHLEKMLQAGKIINNILGRLAQHSLRGGLGKELTLLHSWGNDLIHLVTKFGREMSFSPSSIPRLIPPFCPIDSAPNRQFSSPHKGISVLGRSSGGWQDCLSILNYTKPARPIAVAVSQNLFGLGLSTGSAIIYNDLSCQEERTLQHGEPVWALAFSDDNSACATAGARTVRVWNLADSTETFRFTIPVMCLSLAFGVDDMVLFAATKSNELMCWNLAEGGTGEPRTSWTDDFDVHSALQCKQPTLAAFCSEQSLLAVVYRGEDIILWDYERDRVHDVYEKETGSSLQRPLKTSYGSTTVWSLQFGTLRDDILLIAAYSDGDLVIYDTLDGTVRDILIGVNAHKLSCSPDGRTLACADSRGDIQLFDLETAKLIYRLAFEDDTLASKALAFTSDSHRLIDIRSNQCRMWDPAVLVRQDMDEENNDTVSVTPTPHEVSFHGSLSNHITTIECVNLASLVFCGKEDGSVHIYEIAREPKSTMLFQQGDGIAIKQLHFNIETAVLACSDVASRVTIRCVKPNGQTSWIATDPIIDFVVGQNITQLLSSAKHSKHLIATDEQNYLCSISEDAEKTPRYIKKSDFPGQWIQHGTNADLLILVSAVSAHIYFWETFEKAHTVLLVNLHQPFVAIDQILPLRHPRYFATVSFDPSRRTISRLIRIYDFKAFSPDTQNADCTQDLGDLSSSVHKIIGVYNDRLVFLDKTNWVRSIEIDATDVVHDRHFFLPSDWVSLVRELVLDIGQSGELIFAKRAELLIVKRGLEMTDQGVLTPRKRGRRLKSAMFGGLQYRTTSH